ncbi:glycosyltransferase [Mycobacterium phage Ariel]|uniref:glycosyltransferase n=1 Tax=Mycobacterium phage Ariel TaxID=1541824 RepID=UPI0004F6468B|nr:glycosyltransferase [Mycobacterium phage Ariel]AIM49892.1 glycosyltransferase [Mycobacterium phage Ariel]
MRDVILASFFTGRVDPQRGSRLAADPAALKALHQSVGDRLVVLHDCFNSLPCENYRVEAPEVAYRQRWIAHFQWLRKHPEVRYAWMVDATDVVMLREPWGDMEPGVLYCGWEPVTVGIPWMRDHSEKVADWIEAHKDAELLNCGVVGGDRATVMDLCRQMNDMWAETRADALHEMPFFNIVARRFDVMTGPEVTTVFKAYADNGEAWFQHK